MRPYQKKRELFGSKVVNSKLKSVPVIEGERIEDKVSRFIKNNEPIEDGAPIIYTERGEGVHPAFNIKTDWWEQACEVKEKIASTLMAEGHGKVIEMKPKEDDGDDGIAESTHGKQE